MEKKHLPMYGIGPIYVCIILFITALGIILTNMNVIPNFNNEILKNFFIIVGILLIVFGLYVWVRAVIIEKIDESIKDNKLRTTGIYGIVRNPIYSAFLCICTGILFIENNIYLFILPVIYWLFLTILLKNTEEIWLHDMFGKEYEEYCNKVNRCIPFKRK